MNRNAVCYLMLACAVGLYHQGCNGAPGGGGGTACSGSGAEGSPCDDGDACTEDDQCVEAECIGTPLSCDSPPSTSCIDDATLREYEVPGSCSDGECSYPPVEQSGSPAITV